MSALRLGDLLLDRQAFADAAQRFRLDTEVARELVLRHALHEFRARLLQVQVAFLRRHGDVGRQMLHLLAKFFFHRQAAVGLKARVFLVEGLFRFEIRDAQAAVFDACQSVPGRRLRGVGIQRGDRLVFGIESRRFFLAVDQLVSADDPRKTDVSFPCNFAFAEEDRAFFEIANGEKSMMAARSSAVIGVIELIRRMTSFSGSMVL